MRRLEVVSAADERIEVPTGKLQARLPSTCYGRAWSSFRIARPRRARDQSFTTSSAPSDRCRSGAAVSRLTLVVANVAWARSPTPSSRAAANTRRIPSRRWGCQFDVRCPSLRCQRELNVWYEAPKRALGTYSALSQRSTELNAVLELPSMPSLLL